MGTMQELGTMGAVERGARIDLAAAFRLAARMDLHEGVCNHFSLMLPDGKRFLLNGYGLHWSEVTASNLLALDAEGNILEGDGEFEKTAFYIHSRIHLANPRAACVLHTHMPYATTLTLIENGRLEMVEQNALRFHEDIAYDDTYNGLVVDNAEGDRLALGLGGSNPGCSRDLRAPRAGRRGVLRGRAPLARGDAAALREHPPPRPALSHRRFRRRGRRLRLLRALSLALGLPLRARRLDLRSGRHAGPRRRRCDPPPADPPLRRARLPAAHRRDRRQRPRRIDQPALEPPPPS